MHEIPKRMPPEATCENTKPGQFRDEPCSSLWFWLLVWASLRLCLVYVADNELWLKLIVHGHHGIKAVAVIWITLLMTILYYSFSHYWVHRASIDGFPKELRFKIIAVVLQLLEFKMIVTFVVAGMKNSVVLYRAYYRYCILALIFYIIAMTLCFIPDYRDGHYYGEIYLSYHISILISLLANCDFLFSFAVILNICLDVFLICWLKKVINKYSQTEDKTTSEKV